MSSDIVEQLIVSLLPIKTIQISTGNRWPKKVDTDLLRFLSSCNGGYTQDYFFHFFGTQGPKEHNIFEWNNPDLWKKHFGIGEDIFFFAEDIWGHQYGFDL